jgi:hypothetical protein
MHVRAYAFIQRNKRIQSAGCQRIGEEICGGDFAELLQPGSCRKGLTREMLTIENINGIERALHSLLCYLHASETVLRCSEGIIEVSNSLLYYTPFSCQS